jgi:predicted nucleotidyltransferase
MSVSSQAQDCKRVTELARETPGLDLLLLFGSQARGDEHSGSDWDFAFLAGRGFDVDGLLAKLVALLGTDRVDLVDLSRANGLLRYRAAAEGRPLFESEPGLYEQFWVEAVSYWCDMGPIIEAGYENVLKGLTA